MKDLKKKKIWGFQYRGNGYGWFTYKEALKKADKKPFWNVWLYMKYNGEITPVRRIRLSS